MRFIHTADWQIGMKRHFLDGDAQARFSEAREEAIKTIGKVAREHSAEFVVVAGDVFEANMLSPRTVRRALEAMRSIPVPVYLLPGNHDHLGPATIYHSPEFLRQKPDNVQVLESSGIVEGPGGVEIVGVPWMAKQQVEDRVGTVVQNLPPTEGRLRVVVGHGGTEAMGRQDDIGIIDIATVEESMRQQKLHYLALGDRHSTTNLGSTGRIWYSGAPEPTDYDEVDAGNVLLVDMEPDAIDVAPIHTGTWHFVERMLEVDAGMAGGAFESFLDNLPDKARTIVKVNFRGTIGMLDRMKLDDVLERQRDVFGAIERHEHRDELAVMPDSGDFGDLSLAGYAKAALEKLTAGAAHPDPNESQRYRDALALYYRLAQEVR